MEDRAAFGPYLFDRATGMLSRDGKPVSLGTRGAALLGALIEADGATVTKDALMEAGWPGVTVEEANLSVQVANLRKAMGPRQDGLDWIATVPRVGYRLLRPASDAGEASSATMLPTLAVLPFDNLSGDPDQDYFADGIVEDIITALSRFRSFAVVARSSSFTYKGRAVDVREVARELNVRYVLEGSVRKSAGRLRINAQLVDGGSGAHLWAQVFDGTIDEVFDCQDRITESVVGVVEPSIELAEIGYRRRERPRSLGAYDLYLQAMSIIRTGDPIKVQKGVALLEDALRIDPDYAPALAWNARTRFMLVYFGGPAMGDPATLRDYAERAQFHANSDATVLSMCALLYINALGDQERAMALMREAVEINPHNIYAVHAAGLVNLHCGDLDEATMWFERALRLDPRHAEAVVPLGGLAHVAVVREQYQSAINWALKATAKHSGFPFPYWMLAAANAHLGRMEEAAHYLRELLRVAPASTIAGIRSTQPNKIPGRIEPVLDGLRLAGLPEQ